MASLTDLFNPTFLMFLGILVLVVALVIVYFESKMREQNHKINSMFSIVSTIAEDMTGMRMGMNQIAATQFSQPVNENIFYQPLEEKRENKLITVSDDEDSDNEEEEDSVDEEVSVDEEGSLDEEDSVDEEGSIDSISINNIEDDDLDELSEEEGEQIKVFKLNISKEDDDNNDDDKEDDDEQDNIEELHSDNDLEETPIAPISKIDTSELKTISINLEESIEKIDYKKLQLPKLKSIVVEKGLTTASDASKLKKAELLKLLGIE
jgi:hypothetical protein